MTAYSDFVFFWKMYSFSQNTALPVTTVWVHSVGSGDHALHG